MISFRIRTLGGIHRQFGRCLVIDRQFGRFPDDSQRRFSSQGGGRLGIFELMNMSAGIREMTFNRAPNQGIRRQARLAGMRTLLEDGVDKAVKGITTLEQVLSTCPHELETDGSAS